MESRSKSTTLSAKSATPCHVAHYALQEGVAAGPSTDSGLVLTVTAIRQPTNANCSLLSPFRQAAQACLNTELIAAARSGHVSSVVALLDQGAQLDHRDCSACTWSPLDLAANNGHKDVVKLLLDRGAEVKAKDAKGWTALHIAAWHGCKRMVALLLERGAEVDAKAGSDWSPLHRAASNNHKDVVVLLLGKGANMGAKDSAGKTPLDLAAAKGHTNVVEALKQVNKRDHLQCCIGVCFTDLFGDRLGQWL